MTRKAAKTSNVIATARALACKLAKAAWYLMAEETTYDPARMFASKRPKRNENLNLGARPSARERGWLQALRDLLERAALRYILTTQWNCSRRKLYRRFDPLVRQNQKQVGSMPAPGDRSRRKPKLLETE